jgi:large subunit ribosomal protein L23
MGLMDRLKKKFETTGTKKVQNPVAEKPAKKKKSEGAPALNKDEIKRAQAMEHSVKSEEPQEKKSKKKEQPKGPRDTKTAYAVLLKPAFTEKNAMLTSSSTYVFEVHPKTTKQEIAKAVSAVYGVKPIAVRVSTLNPKKITFGRLTGTTKIRKKAFVTLPKGKTIDVYQS